MRRKKPLASYATLSFIFLSHIQLPPLLLSLGANSTTANLEHWQPFKWRPKANNSNSYKKFQFTIQCGSPSSSLDYLNPNPDLQAPSLLLIFNSNRSTTCPSLSLSNLNLTSPSSPLRFQQQLDQGRFGAKKPKCLHLEQFKKPETCSK